jgi:hypothetical protein
MTDRVGKFLFQNNFLQPPSALTNQKETSLLLE